MRETLPSFVESNTRAVSSSDSESGPLSFLASSVMSFSSLAFFVLVLVLVFSFSSGC